MLECANRRIRCAGEGALRARIRAMRLRSVAMARAQDLWASVHRWACGVEHRAICVNHSAIGVGGRCLHPCGWRLNRTQQLCPCGERLGARQQPGPPAPQPGTAKTARRMAAPKWAHPHAPCQSVSATPLWGHPSATVQYMQQPAVWPLSSTRVRGATALFAGRAFHRPLRVASTSAASTGPTSERRRGSRRQSADFARPPLRQQRAERPQQAVALARLPTVMVAVRGNASWRERCGQPGPRRRGSIKADRSASPGTIRSEGVCDMAETTDIVDGHPGVCVCVSLKALVGQGLCTSRGTQQLVARPKNGRVKPDVFRRNASRDQMTDE